MVLTSQLAAACVASSTSLCVECSFRCLQMTFCCLHGVDVAGDDFLRGTPDWSFGEDDRLLGSFHNFRLVPFTVCFKIVSPSFSLTTTTTTITNKVHISPVHISCNQWISQHFHSCGAVQLSSRNRSTDVVVQSNCTTVCLQRSGWLHYKHSENENARVVHVTQNAIHYSKRLRFFSYASFLCFSCTVSVRLFNQVLKHVRKRTPVLLHDVLLTYYGGLEATYKLPWLILRGDWDDTECPTCVMSDTGYASSRQAC